MTAWSTLRRWNVEDVELLVRENLNPVTTDSKDYCLSFQIHESIVVFR